MKKYHAYIPLICIMICAVLSLAIWGKRNDFHIALRETSDSEHESVGNFDEIKDLKYTLGVGTYNQDWIIKGNGKNLTTTYTMEPDQSVYLSHRKYNFKYYRSIRPILNEAYFDKKDVKTAKESGYSTDENYNMVKVQKADFIFEVYDADKNRIPITTFQIETKNKEKELDFSYTLPDAPEQKVWLGGEGQYYNDFTDLNEEPMILNDMEFIAIGVGSFDFKPSEVNFSKPVGGIYRIENGKVKQIVKMDMDQDMLYTACLGKDKLYAIVQKKGTVYLDQYDIDGKLLHEMKLNIEPNLNEAEITVKDDRVFASVVVATDTMNRTTSVVTIQNMDVETFRYDAGNYNYKYKYKDGKLIILSKQSNTINLRVLDKDKKLFDSDFYGDYQDDQKITLDSRYYSSEYVNPIYRLLNTEQREIGIIDVE